MMMSEGGKMVKFSVYVDGSFYATGANEGTVRQLARLMSFGGHLAEVTDTSGAIMHWSFRNGEEIRKG
jgi:hypothetical protein